MKYFLFLLLFITSSSTKLISQNFVNDSQKQKFINLNTKFPILNQQEKYSLIDDNEFLIITKKSKKKECVFLDSIFKNNINLSASFLIGPSENKNTCFGIKIVSTVDTNQYLTILINKNGKFRVNENMWKRNNNLNISKGYNSIKVISNNKSEIYINNIFVEVIDKINSQNVNVGICISSQSKARLSYFSILENKDLKIKTLTKELTKSDETNRFNEQNLVLYNQKTIKKQIFSVQIGTYLTEKDFLLDSKEIWFKKTKENTFIYYSGNFLTDIEATIHKNNLEKKGYKNIFVNKIEKQSNEE
ncbi:MAG: hypothetical protein CMD36_03555 [Flavobacteriales bacterium]|nr:hypothetical protein [Flavobacteriales bacterium]|tara:strand:- start:2642 stop:3550 length:909 start_codon:yes stop_codon:yes gene_type:complete